jgi:hypothetical protein
MIIDPPLTVLIGLQSTEPVQRPLCPFSQDFPDGQSINPKV